MNLTLLLVVTLITPCFKLEPQEIEYQCYHNVDAELRIYEKFSPRNAQMIPYRNWCSFISCLYNNCETIESAPSCQGE